MGCAGQAVRADVNVITALSVCSAADFPQKAGSGVRGRAHDSGDPDVAE